MSQILLMSDQSEFEDLRLEMQKAKKKGNSLALLGKVSRLCAFPPPDT